MTYAFYKRRDDGKWVVESKDGVDTSLTEHTSRAKALAAFFQKHPGNKQFVVLLPELSEATIRHG